MALAWITLGDVGVGGQQEVMVGQWLISNEDKKE